MNRLELAIATQSAAHDAHEATDRLLRQEPDQRLVAAVSDAQRESAIRNREALAYLQDEYAIQSSHCERQYSDAVTEMDTLKGELTKERNRLERDAEQFKLETEALARQSILANNQSHSSQLQSVQEELRQQ